MPTLATDVQLPPRIQQALDEAVQAIVAAADPQAVILFGSWAEGRGQDDSDLDLLVVAETPDQHDLTVSIRGAIDDAQEQHWRDRPDVELIVLTPEQWEYESRLPGLTIFRARRRGVVVHGRVT